ncbi:MAG: hypothetical protein ABI718_03805 [Acidobacteriota bacterium]
MTSRFLLLLLLSFSFSSKALCQTPSADWRTIETSHFRFHFPSQFEDWTRAAAGKMESVRSDVMAAVGYEPKEKVDVLVMDPVAEANGSAWPILGRARIILWTSPPGPDSQIGNYADFVELLTVHEETHIVHLLRPSRSPLGRLYATLLPIGPISLSAPRWVVEGYATLVEGELTGSGRPNSALRSSILRRWAQLGRLPGYSRLSSGSESWMGMSMAYLVGSAYLEWLQERRGPDSLRRLWARMTAREERSFDEAFAGVFGERPAQLYDRFTAELTYRAIAVEKERLPSLREGELWQEFDWTTGAPQISPDGEKLLTVVSDRDEPQVLTIFSTSPDPKAEESFKKRIAAMIEKDPADVAPVDKPLPHKTLDELNSLDFARYISPRWLGSDEVIYEQSLPDHAGVLHPDLFRWNPELQTSDRLSWGADLREADPFPDGSAVVAVRQRYGKSQLVLYDLQKNIAQPLTEAGVSETYSWPRVSADGGRIVYVVHRDRRWNLAVMDLATRRSDLLESSDGLLIAQPAWSSDGRAVYAAVGRDGFIDIERFPLSGGPSVAITRTQGAALAPAPSPDGAWVYFLSMTADGFDIRRIAVDAQMEPLPELHYPADLLPLAGTPPAVSRRFAVQPAGPTRPYGIGPQEVSLLESGNAAPGARNFEVGVRIGDVVGRLDTLVVGSFFGNRGPRGGALATVWRGWPVVVGFHVFSANEGLSRAIEQGGVATSERGIQLKADWTRQWRDSSLEITTGLLGERLKGSATDRRFGEHFVYASSDFDGVIPRGTWRVPYGVHTEGAFGSTEGDSWTRESISLEGGVLVDRNGLELSYSRGTSNGLANPADRFLVGGLPSTIVPESAWMNRIFIPALEPGVLSGTEFEDQKVTFSTSALPLTPFYERVRAWDGQAASGEWLALAGLELNLSVENMPVLQFPGIGIRLGAARILDAPLRNRTRWWVGLTYRP